MDARKLGGIILLVLLVGILWWRFRGSDGLSDEIKADSFAMIASMDDYATHKAVIDPMVEQAHASAFESARSASGGGDDDFDQDRYDVAFFELMISQARASNRTDIEKALLKLRGGNRDAGRVDSFAPDLGS